MGRLVWTRKTWTRLSGLSATGHDVALVPALPTTANRRALTPLRLHRGVLVQTSESPSRRSRRISTCHWARTEVITAIW